MAPVVNERGIARRSQPGVRGAALSNVCEMNAYVSPFSKSSRSTSRFARGGAGEDDAPEARSSSRTELSIEALPTLRIAAPGLGESSR